MPAGAVEVVQAILSQCSLVGWVAACMELVGQGRLVVGSMVSRPSGVATLLCWLLGVLYWLLCGTGGRLRSAVGAAGGLGMPDRHGVGRALGSAGGGLAVPGSSDIMRRRGVVPITCMERYAWAARDTVSYTHLTLPTTPYV